MEGRGRLREELKGAEMLLGRRLGQHMWDQAGFEEYTGDGAVDSACQTRINCLCLSARGMEEGRTLVNRERL